MNNTTNNNYFNRLNNFDDIYEITKNMTATEKGDIFEIISLYMFKLSPLLNNDLQEIWLYKDIPVNIRKSLDLPEKDKGIDILAKIKNKYCAIQCKFRQNPDQRIQWKELATFFGLSFGINDKINSGYLITNTNDICDEVNKSTKVRAVYGDFFDNLPNNFFKNIYNDINKKALITYTQKKPFPYQLECIEKCFEHYTTIISNDEDEIDQTRGYIEMACGTGKSLTSYWIDKRLRNKKTVVFVPSLYLLSQFYSDWINQSYAENIKIKYLLIGSDADVDNETKYKSNGLVLETDPQIIRDFLDDNKDQKIVVISTYQSSKKLAEACDSKIEFDFAIFDEAHKTVGQVGKKFSMMLTNEKMIIRERLFMTATPKVYNGNVEDDEIISMDDETYYGQQIYCYNTGNAINEKRLVDYKLVTIIATDKEIETSIRDNKLIKYKKEFTDEESNYLGTIIVLLKKIHDGTCNHIITYHNTVKRAIKFKDYLVKINNLLYKDNEIYADSMDGSVSMSKRKGILKDYVNKNKGVLSSARVLNEGINIPIVDSVCFVDARFSTIDIVQCVGRALRLFNGKTCAHIFIPTFVKNIDDKFDKNVYGNIIRILKAMKSTDESVMEYFDAKDSAKTATRKICVVERLTDVKKSIEISLSQWNSEISCEVWKLTADNVDRWMTIFEEVKKHTNENYNKPNIKIRPNISWVTQQNKNYKYKMGSMKNKNVYDKWTEFINDAKYKIYFKSKKDMWIIIFEKIKKHIDEHNTLPINYDENIKQSVQAWIHGQNRNYKNKTCTMKHNDIYAMWEKVLENPKYKQYFAGVEKIKKELVPVVKLETEKVVVHVDYAKIKKIKWYSEKDRLAEYIKKNNKLPSIYDNDNKVQELSRWMLLYNYRRDIYSMTRKYDMKFVYEHTKKY